MKLTMKLNQISRAMLAACGTLASISAFALPASDYSAAPTQASEFVGKTQNIRISGATAQDPGLLGSALSLCTTGSLHRYVASNNFAYFCTPDVGTGAGQIVVRDAGTGPAVTQLAIYKYSLGGSSIGVEAVNNASALPFLDLAKIATSPACSGGNLTTAISDFNGTSTPGGTYVNNTCGGASSLITTDATTYIGLSDVEPAFFTNATGNLTAENFSTLIFGVPVTTNIRNALQATAITAGKLALTCDDSDAARDTLDCMPSLSRGQITSAFTQLGQTWTGIGVSSGLTDDRIYVARRINGSGTQKTFEALVAGTPNRQSSFKSCTVGVNLFLDTTTGSNPGNSTGDADSTCGGATTTMFVYGGNGGGNVSNCMNNHNTNNRGAIGMQTGEVKPGTSGWRFIKVDGAAPIHQDVAAGRYTFWTQASINTRKPGAPFPTLAAAGYEEFVKRIKADLSNPAIVNLINGENQTFGKSGVMANFIRTVDEDGEPTNSPDFSGTNPVNPYNRITGGSTVNNCQPIKAPF